MKNTSPAGGTRRDIFYTGCLRRATTRLQGRPSVYWGPPQAYRGQQPICPRVADRLLKVAARLPRATARLTEGAIRTAY